MKRLALVSAALSTLLLAACATTGTGAADDAGLRPSQSAEVEPDDEGRSGYGLFLAGQAAQSDGQNEAAASYFERATIAGAEVESLKQRTFQAALFGGDIAQAARLAPGDGEAPLMVIRLGQLTRAVEDIASGDGAAARTILIDEGIGYPHRQVAALLGPWAAAAAGDTEGALARPSIRGDRIVEVFGLLNQALLLERFKRYDDAEANFKILMAYGDASAIFAPDYGAFLERRKRRAEAVAVYEAALKVRPGDEGLTAARDRAASRRGKAPEMTTIKQGAARALLIPASALSSEKQYSMALAYLRLSARLDSGRDDLWIEMGDAFTGLEDTAAARSAYAQVRVGSREFSTARSRLAWSYQAAGEKEQALAMAAEGAKSGKRDALVTYADVLRANERYAESAAVLDKVIAMDGAGNWRLLYMRGIARDLSGDWPGAEADAQAALALEPDEPELLNYLGYSWIDRGERLPEAMAMVQKAVAANPRSGAMVDSLGWAYFRMGDYRNAVEQLEKAVLLEPADPDVNDHLGDAYWQVGRRIEARFQWNRALQLDPDDKKKAAIETKLKTGLSGVKPVVAER